MAGVTIALETAAEVDSGSLPSNETGAHITSLSLNYVIWVFVMPVALLVGIVGNVLSIVVLQSKAFRRTTTGVYLPITAVADTIHVVVGCQEILEVAGIFSAREYNVWACRAYKVIYYTSGDAAIWLLVAFTFDRFVAVCFPLRKRRVCRWKRAVIASATIIFLSLAKNFHEFWTRGPEYTESGEFVRICGRQKRYKFFLDYVRPWIAIILITVVPFILILFFNCMIVHSLLKAQRLRSKNAAYTEACATPTGTGNKPPTSATSFRQTTFMCLGVSFAFLILVAPSVVLLTGKPYWKRGDAAAYGNAKAISNFLSILHHCINFFLYCVTGRRFRQELKATLTCRRGTEVPQIPTCTENDATVGQSSAAPLTSATAINSEPRQQVSGQLDQPHAAND